MSKIIIKLLIIEKLPEIEKKGVVRSENGEVLSLEAFCF